MVEWYWYDIYDGRQYSIKKKINPNFGGILVSVTPDPVKNICKNKSGKVVAEEAEF